jgi:hypothetical protein
VLRWLSGGLRALYGVQIGLHLASGALIGAAARARFGERCGLAAAAAFLLLIDPALFAMRVLAATLQIFLVALLWWDWARLAERGGPSAAHEVRVGAWIGALALAFPAAQLLVPVYAAWLWLARRSGAARTALGAGAALLVIAPATLHNLLCSGEWIPITAHAGVTLAEGNGPDSIGIYTPISGVSRSILEQSRDARKLFEAETGRPGSWGEVDAFFKRRVFAWWRAHPLDAARLFALKLRWLVSARYYDSVTAFSLEREHGLGVDAPWLLPIELPWLFGAALLGLLLLRRDGARGVPELFLLALPAFTCVVFHYTGRYRVVDAPIACGLAARALVHWRELRWPRAAVLAVALLPVPLLALNAVTGFEDLGFMREPFARALAHEHLLSGAEREARGDEEAALGDYRRAVAANAGSSEAWRRLYNLQARRGDQGAAARSLAGLVAAAPSDVEAHLALAWLLSTSPDAAVRDGAAAERSAREALRLAGDGAPDAHLALALAEAELGHFDAAQASARRARERAAARGDAALVRDLDGLLARLASRRAVSSTPRQLHVAAR